MGNNSSLDVEGSDDDENSSSGGAPSAVMIRQKLEQLDVLLEESAPPSDDFSWTTATVKGEDYCDVVIGTSGLARQPGMVGQIAAIAGQSKRLSPHDVVDRLSMGDDGVQANRVTTNQQRHVIITTHLATGAPSGLQKGQR